MKRKTIILPRRDTLENWRRVNPVLEENEIVIVLDEQNRRSFRRGNGKSEFMALQPIYDFDIEISGKFMVADYVIDFDAPIHNKYTPENIQDLGKDEIFVFGSNENGDHIGGAARVANVAFGAQWGVCEGITGRSYAIPTLDKDMLKVSKDKLTLSFQRFIKYAAANSDKTFLLTKIGCGIAGWKLEEVVDCFREASCNWGFMTPSNIIFPLEFAQKLNIVKS